MKEQDEDTSPLQKTWTLEEFNALCDSFSDVKRSYKRPKDTITSSQMNKMIAKTIGYELYEVQDVMQAYNSILRQALLQGRAISIPNIGYFRPKQLRPKMMYIGYKQDWYAIPARISMSFKFSKPFEDAMRYSLRKIAEQAGELWKPLEIDYVNSLNGANPDDVVNNEVNDLSLDERAVEYEKDEDDSKLVEDVLYDRKHPKKQKRMKKESVKYDDTQE